MSKSNDNLMRIIAQIKYYTDVELNPQMLIFYQAQLIHYLAASHEMVMNTGSIKFSTDTYNTLKEAGYYDHED